MNNCQEYIIKMNQYLDSELPVDEIADLLRHIETCVECRQRFENLKIAVFETRHIQSDPPPELHDSIMRRIAQETPIHRKRNLSRFAALAACAALLVVMASTVTPWLRNLYMFSDMSADSSTGAGDDSPENAKSLQESSDAYDAAAPADAILGAENHIADEDNGSGRLTAEGKTPQSGDSAEDPAQFGIATPGTMMQAAGYDHTLFTAPQLGVSESVAFYIIAMGNGDPSELFQVESIINEREVGEAYIFVANTPEDKTEAEQLLQDAGFTLYDNVENLPEIDPEAEQGLIVVFESR